VMDQGWCVFFVALGLREVLAYVLIVLEAEDRGAWRMAGIDLAASRIVLRRADISACDVRKFECGDSRPGGACHISSPYPSIVLACGEATGLRRTDRCQKL